MQINAYQEGTKITSEVNESVLKNIGTNSEELVSLVRIGQFWRILPYALLISTSTDFFSLAQLPTEMKFTKSATVDNNRWQ